MDFARPSAIPSLRSALETASRVLGGYVRGIPWDGKLDVEYWAKNTPNGAYQLKVTVSLPDGTSASQTVDALNGKNTAVFDAEEAFGEVKFTKGVKVKAELVEAPSPN